MFLIYVFPAVLIRHLKMIGQLLNEILSGWHYNTEQLNNVLWCVALVIWKVLHVIELNKIGII